MRNLDWPITTRYITNTYFLLFKCFTAIGYTSIEIHFTSSKLPNLYYFRQKSVEQGVGWMDGSKALSSFFSFSSLQHIQRVVPQIPFKLTHWMQQQEMFAILTSNCYKYLFHNAQTNKGEIGLYFCYNEKWYFVKVQLISKQNCRAINSPKKQTLDFYF